MVGRVASWRAVGRGRDDTGRRGDDRGRDGGRGDLVVVVVVFFGRQGKWCGFAGVDGFAPELEVPVDPCAVEFVDLGVFDDDGPGADAGFAPMMIRVNDGRREA